MDLKFLKINLLIIGIFLFGMFVVTPTVQAKDIDIHVNVYTCNNNGVCDSGLGEDAINCPSDCSVIPICNNNGTCEPDQGENNSNCPLDCPTLPACNNNGICESGLGENESNCYSDCHVIVPTTTTSTVGGGVVLPPPDKNPPVINYLKIFNITQTSAEVSWRTDKLAFCELDFGDTYEYKDGSISESSFLYAHSTELPNLKPGTDYYFMISCFDQSHNLGRLTNQHFSTFVLPGEMSPQNIYNLKATPGDGQVTLTWNKSQDLDYQGVMIRSSDMFYPNIDSIGLIYNGMGEKNGVSGNRYIDIGLVNGKTYYYTLFAYNSKGNHASGVSIKAIPSKYPVSTITSTIPVTATSSSSTISRQTKLKLDDFTFIGINDYRDIPVVGDRVDIKAGLPISLYINDGKIPKGTKDIILTVGDYCSNQVYIFDLETGGRRQISGFGVSQSRGVYNIDISFFDEDHKLIESVKGYFNVKEGKKPYLLVNTAKSTKNLLFSYWWLLLMIVLVVIWWLLVWKRRRKKKE